MMCDDDQIRTFFILTFFQKKKKRFTEINYSVIRGRKPLLLCLQLQRERHFSPLKYISIPWKTGEERRTKNASGELCFTFGFLLVLVLVLDD